MFQLFNKMINKMKKIRIKKYEFLFVLFTLMSFMFLFTMILYFNGLDVLFYSKFDIFAYNLVNYINNYSYLIIYIFSLPAIIFFSKFKA